MICAYTCVHVHVCTVLECTIIKLYTDVLSNKL